MAMQIKGRDVLERPTCPFCGTLIDRPHDEPDLTLNEMPVGACQCGAVYACDVTGHNLGIAFTEALVYSCNGDWDKAWDLFPDQDYLQKELTGYDYEEHLIVHGAMHGGRRITGVLYFIKLREEIRLGKGAVTTKSQHIQRKDNRPEARSDGTKRISSKRKIESLVKSYRVEELLALAHEDKKIIRDLQRLIYSVDDLTRWRATDLLGQAASVIAKYDPGAISKLMQRLLSSVVDTAASSWGAIDAIGDIICNNVEDFGGYIPRLFGLAMDRELLPDLIRNFAKIAKRQPDLLRPKAYAFIPLLKHESPEVRGYTAQLLGAVKASEAKENLETLINDDAPVLIYSSGEVTKSTVGNMASQALTEL